MYCTYRIERAGQSVPSFQTTLLRDPHLPPFRNQRTRLRLRLPSAFRACLPTRTHTFDYAHFAVLGWAGHLLEPILPFRHPRSHCPSLHSEMPRHKRGPFPAAAGAFGNRACPGHCPLPKRDPPATARPAPFPRAPRANPSRPPTRPQRPPTAPPRLRTVPACPPAHPTHARWTNGRPIPGAPLPPSTTGHLPVARRALVLPVA